jgi:hypothetical protein
LPRAASLAISCEMAGEPSDRAAPGRARAVARVLRILALAIAGSWAAYALAAQALLWTPLLRRIVNANAPTVRLEYRHAWSAWPGRVHVDSLRLTSQDRAVQWQLDIDRATVSIALWQLPRRVFHATQVRADGVAFALRRRIPKPRITPDRLEGLPPIAGFGPVPVGEEGPEDDLPDWRYRLFTVWLEDVAAQRVRRVWVDGLRLEGDARVAGAFYLKPIRRVLVEPAELQAESLAISERTVPVARALKTRLRVRLGPFDPRGITPAKVAPLLDLEAAAAGRLAGVEFLSRAAGIPLSGGEGPVRFDVRVTRGIVQPGSELAAELGGASAGLRRLEARAHVLTASAAVPAQGASHVRIEARGLSAAAARKPAARVSTVRLLLEGPAPDLRAPQPPRSAALDVRGGRIEDAKPLADAFGLRLLRVEGGHGAFALHLAGPARRMSGWLRASLASGRASFEQSSFRGDFAVDAPVRDLDPWRGGDLSGTQVRVDDARLVHGGEEDAAPGWWARIVARRARLRLAAESSAPDPSVSREDLARRVVVEGEVVARCRDARPLVGLYARRSDLPGFVSGLFSMERLEVRSSVALGDGLIALRDLVATGDGASIRATYLAAGEQKQGAALLEVRGLPVGVGLGEGQGGIHLFGPGDWFSGVQARLQSQVGTPAQAEARTAPPRRRPGRESAARAARRR